MKRIIKIFAVFVSLLLAGVYIFHYVEGRGLVESVYATVVTLATVGYGDVTPVTKTGRILTIFFILIGISLLTYVLSTITAFIIEGELSDILRRKKMLKKISGLKGHIVLCGLGTAGFYIAGELHKTGRKCVVVEKDLSVLPSGKDENDEMGKAMLFINGDATRDEVLVQAGIKEASGLITVLPDDRDNLFVVMSARSLNSGLRIISRCKDSASEPKLKTAGANSVVLPDFIGGMRMVSEMVRPSVVTFLDLMLKDKDRTLRIEEVNINAASVFAGKKISELGIEKFKEAIVVAVAEGKKYAFNPPGNYTLKPGEALIFWGAVTDINKIREVSEGK